MLKAHRFLSPYLRDKSGALNRLAKWVDVAEKVLEGGGGGVSRAARPLSRAC